MLCANGTFPMAEAKVIKKPDTRSIFFAYFCETLKE